MLEIKTVSKGPFTGTIQGLHLPFYSDGSPVVVFMADQPFVGLYSNRKLLQDAMKSIGVEKYTLRQIVDQSDFIKSVREQGVRIIVNPMVSQGKTRFTEVTDEITI